MSNRLAAEQSPYLLQHKDNPVDWYPWGEAAFEKARREDKPIFLSVGYSTCHWCHVMEHESFESPSVAEMLNEHFVSIKVDREERPDVDRVYMTFVQVTTGSGGWPMSVWLTPSLEPFYGGTYFPPTSRWGRPGFVEVLEEIARVWRDDREKVVQSGKAIVERLRSLGGATGAAVVPGTDALDAAVREFAASFDARRGGFGAAPKFPRPSELLFLLREHRRTRATEPRDMVLATLRAMALGGMRDHLGGGFHRYSVDADWRVPHFEKMLYDQAQLTLAYLETAQLAGDRFFAAVAADTLAYVRRDLTNPEGGFYSAEDADSVPPERAHEAAPHKSEGPFYIWLDEEIGRALGPDADFFRLRYGVLPDGNAPFDPQNEFAHKNLLYTARSVEEIARMTGHPAEEVASALDRARATLLAVRSTRPRPHLDDKILTAWNGLMIAAFARAARVLENGDAYLADARRAAAFVRARLWRAADETLLRRFRQGEAAVEGYAEDYAYLTFGLLELFQADGDPAWLEWALALQRRLDGLFRDPADGGWYSTTGKDASVLLRLKEEYDGAEPAASSVAVLNLLTLSHLAGSIPNAPTPNSQPLGVAELGIGSSYHEPIAHAFAMFGASASMRGRAVPMMLAALSTYYAGMPQIVLVGEREAPDTQALAAVVRQHYLPTAVVVPVTGAHQQVLARLLPWTAALTARGGQATAYVCGDFACHAPTTSPDDLDAQLREL
ncbi:MAG: thioredoxin domain-containing protein [Acidobacteria bacterium]|nr:thioredoxin domain-containing protein [Acidobacteriota bacterium]